jgi:hypothetical protein
MKKLNIIFILAGLTLMSAYYGCNSTSTVAYPPGIINGIVLDSITLLPIDSATISTDISGFGAYTDTGGHFRISYENMPSSGVNLIVIADKNGYVSRKSYIWLLSNDSVYVRLLLLPSSDYHRR